MGDTAETDQSSGRSLKVTRLIDEYGLAGIGAELEQRWTETGPERMSLRALADYFNEQLLVAAMAETERQPLDGEAENIYRLLTEDDVSVADKTRTARQLERSGIDVESLQNDFVTYQAIRSYLKEYRDAEYVTDDRDRAVVEAENIQRLRGRLMTVTEGKLDQLRKNDRLDLGEFRLFATINVLCEDCGAQYEIDELFERGGCDCAESE